MPVYSAHLREIIKKGIDHPEDYEQPLKGFKIIVDAGNGSGGFLASDVLAPLGADTSGTHALWRSHMYNQIHLVLPAHIVPLRTILQDFTGLGITSTLAWAPELLWVLVTAVAASVPVWPGTSWCLHLSPVCPACPEWKLFVDEAASLITADADAASEHLINKRSQAACISHISWDDADVNGISVDHESLSEVSTTYSSSLELGSGVRASCAMQAASSWTRMAGSQTMFLTRCVLLSALSLNLHQPLLHRGIGTSTVPALACCMHSQGKSHFTRSFFPSNSGHDTPALARRVYIGGSSCSGVVPTVE